MLRSDTVIIKKILQAGMITPFLLLAILLTQTSVVNYSKKILFDRTAEFTEEEKETEKEEERIPTSFLELKAVEAGCLSYCACLFQVITRYYMFSNLHLYHFLYSGKIWHPPDGTIL